ncbi:MAG TPA: protein kinase, partial [Pyrinomonadaceae bacterium]|nr:protein kinase [Pyrinomonadaceae bacterium]
MKLESGAKINQYEIKSLLGAGGMGEVYLAHDTRLGRDVAIKFLKPTEDREKLARFRREAKVISSLNHPNIVTIFEFNKYQNRHYIVTELVRGKILREAINEKSLTYSEILDIGIQICNALTAAHEAGIIHRDIKPENIMILPDGYVKVLDFGLAKLTDTGGETVIGDDQPTNTLIETRSGMILGTVSYMSPEQLRGRDVDTRTDIWSLGVCLYEMISARRPFDGESISDVIASVINRELPPLNEMGVVVPPEIEEIIKRCLEKDQSLRYASGRDLVADLKEARQMNTTGKTPDLLSQSQKTKTLLTNFQKSPQITDGQKSKQKNNFKYLAVGAVLLLLSLSGFFAYRIYFAETTSKQVKIKRLPASGVVKNAAISPDGQFVTYVLNDNGKESLWLRQTEEAGGQELIPAPSGNYAGLAFSPDGKFIYFTVFEQSSSGKLYRIPLLAGSSRQEIAKDIDSPAAISADGKQIAFIRSDPPKSLDQIILISAEGGNERVLVEKKRPEFFFKGQMKESLSWSPDSKSIAAPTGKTDIEGDVMTISEIDVASGQLKEITSQKWFRVGRVLWANNPEELLVTAAEPGTDLYQIFKVSRSDGKTEKVAPNLNDYHNIS